MPPLALRGVVSAVGRMQKTATVTVTRKVAHPIIGKILTRSKKYLVHDPKDQCKLANEVVIQNSRPISKRKTFVYVKTIRSASKEQAKVVEEANLIEGATTEGVIGSLK